VNISSAHLRDRLFASDVESIVTRSGIRTDSVILEFGESILLADLNEAASRLGSLQKMGIHLAIDDVGTGRATLEYLKRLPVDILKIGRPFVNALLDSGAMSSMAYEIVQQGRALRMGIVAEGVENAEQVAKLRAMGCTMAQGYHLARPGRAAVVDLMLENGPFDVSRFEPLRSSEQAS